MFEIYYSSIQFSSSAAHLEIIKMKSQSSWFLKILFVKRLLKGNQLVLHQQNAKHNSYFVIVALCYFLSINMGSSGLQCSEMRKIIASEILKFIQCQNSLLDFMCKTKCNPWILMNKKFRANQKVIVAYTGNSQ